MLTVPTGVAFHKPRTMHWLISWWHAKRQRTPLAQLSRRVQAAERQTASLLAQWHEKRDRQRTRFVSMKDVAARRRQP